MGIIALCCLLQGFLGTALLVEAEGTGHPAQQKKVAKMGIPTPPTSPAQSPAPSIGH